MALKGALEARVLLDAGVVLVSVADVAGLPEALLAELNTVHQAVTSGRLRMLGPLLTRVRAWPEADALIPVFEEALSHRNTLVHHFFTDSRVHLHSSAGRADLLVQLESIVVSIQAASEKAGALYLSILEEVGLPRQQLLSAAAQELIRMQEAGGA
jgi:hypothetical protein